MDDIDFDELRGSLDPVKERRRMAVYNARQRKKLGILPRKYIKGSIKDKNK